MVDTAGKRPAATARADGSGRPRRETDGRASTVTVAEALDTAATDGQTVVASGCSRRRRSSDRPRTTVSTVVLSAVTVVVLAAATAVDWARTTDICRHWIVTAAELLSVADQKCAIILPDFLEDVLRPPINCSYCIGMDSIEKVNNLSTEMFENHYAYTGRPVVAVSNSEQSGDFGFKLFKNLSNSNLLKACQFFPYKTKFNTLEEALDMDEQRAVMAPGYEPWYIGWSNCDTKTIKHLKKHIALPNFLPPLSDRKPTLWVFMGTPGHGAPMHIDKVGLPSWQTQISGYKKWTLRTPVECFFTCKRQFEVFMEPGSTIVLDTNIWYHKTKTIGQDISITVGGEYD